MPTERDTLLIICVLGCVSYSLRAGGYIAASLFPANGIWARILKLAPGNLFVAFTAVGLWHSGWPVLAGSLLIGHHETHSTGVGRTGCRIRGGRTGRPRHQKLAFRLMP
jgi:hypothetical protein